MKRLVLLVVVALGMSATSFAGEKVEGKGKCIVQCQELGRK